jgi:hypothetical protein
VAVQACAHGWVSYLSWPWPISRESLGNIHGTTLAGLFSRPRRTDERSGWRGITRVGSDTRQIDIEYLVYRSQ